MIDYTHFHDFHYRGMSAAHLDEMIDAYKMHRLEKVVEENARLRQENLQLVRQGKRVEAQTIGQIVQSILDQGFSVNYVFDRWESIGQAHHFGIWKYYGKEKVAVHVLVSDFDLSQMIIPTCFDIEKGMKQIDERITQRMSPLHEVNNE